MNPDIRVRFAPSPTGYLHIGGARTALFNWLFARHHGGKLILRIEDTDRTRHVEEATAAIYDGLKWLGLNWDEGPHVGGDFGPYLQSERTELYERYLKKLQDAGHIFEDQGALRFRSPREHVVVDDLVCGKIDFDLTNPGTHPDMTIRRPDGSWIFHFVNVIDDLEMKISHVIRGEDHLSNTPKHIEIFRALGATPPHYAHIPLILNKDGSKMSKRDEGARVEYYIKRGYLPAAVRNYLCLLGWSPKDNREKIDIEEIIRIFDLNHVGRSHATFDPDKLHWLNGEYARELSDAEFYDLAVARLKSSGVKIDNYRRAIRPRGAANLQRQDQHLRRAAILLRVLFHRRFRLQSGRRRETFHRREQAAAQSCSRRVGRAGQIRRHANRGNVQSHGRQAWRQSRRACASDAARRHRQQRRPESISSARSSRERESARANRSRACDVLTDRHPERSEGPLTNLQDDASYLV